ncbi:MAG TPA: HEAT repeat domain-containing protein, partial [Acidobacteriota bacterium]|nr:HEAT repeat domain-containing protein [Acidobacteriota bacterium]
STDALLQSLSESDAGLRRRAIDGLGKVGDARALPALQTALSDQNASVRAGAVLAFGKIGREQAIPSLLTALQETDVQVRNAAAFALGQIRTPEALKGVLTLVGKSDAGQLAQNRATFDAFLKAYGESAKDVESHTKAADPVLRRGALVALDTLLNAPEATAALQAALKDSAKDIRLLAIDGLLRRKVQASGDTLLALLTSEKEADVRSQVAIALGELANRDNPRLPETLRRAHRTDASPDVREKAGLALDQLGIARLDVPGVGKEPKVAAAMPPVTVSGESTLTPSRPQPPKPQPPKVEPQPVPDSKTEPAEPTTDIASSTTPTTNPVTKSPKTGTATLPPAVASSKQPGKGTPSATKPASSGKETTPKIGSKPATKPADEPLMARAEPPKPAPTRPATKSTTASPGTNLAAKPLPPPPVASTAATRAAVIAANEAAILDVMRMLLEAEETYQAGAGEGEFGGVLDLVAENLIHEEFASGEVSGYRFSLYVSQATDHTKASFFVLATPVGFEETGRRSFFMDASGMTRTRDTRNGVRLEEIFGTWPQTALR